MQANIMEHDFSCVRDKLVIRGKEYCPEGDLLPAVIMSHGFGGNSTNFTQFCQHFATWGYAAYTFDFCGGCAKDTGKSDGSSYDMTLESEGSDLLSVIHYVVSLPYIDKNRITLVGNSQGGLVCALIAARLQDTLPIENLILTSPALCIPDDARTGTLAGTVYSVREVPEIIDNGWMPISRKFHEHAVKVNVWEEIAPYKGRVLLIHGRSDEVVSYQYAMKAVNIYADNQCHLQLVKEAKHCFTESQNESALVSIHQFLLHKDEILTIEVTITGSEIRRQDGVSYCQAILFTGSSESRYFKGRILPGAADEQDHIGEQVVKIRADYTLEGVDYKRQACKVHIINQDVNGEWKPTVTTDSQALAFLNQGDLTAALEFFEGGLTVRIFSDMYE